MFKDGCVLDVQGVRFQHRSDYVALKARVKPRTNEKDPVTIYNYYSVWMKCYKRKNKMNVIIIFKLITI